jgi:hypothetical protein
VLTIRLSHDYSFYEEKSREVCAVRLAKLIILIGLVGTFVWGCVEDVNTGANSKPVVWFLWPTWQDSVIYQNSQDFLWIASDYDDDLGMGETYVSLDPSNFEWYNCQTHQMQTFEYPGGWIRVYENVYQLLDLPDSAFAFRVKVVDGRGASTTIEKRFVVRFDNSPPMIDSVICPSAKPPKVFQHQYVIHAHDVARCPRAATPYDSLEYTYRFRTPCGLEEPDIEWSGDNKSYIVFVDGQSCPGDYTFRCQVRDKAHNVSNEFKCGFTIEQ